MRKAVLALIVWVVACATECGAQQRDMVIAGAAHRTFINGLDTATVERAFCVWWHPLSRDSVSLDSAYVARTVKADSLHVIYDLCPASMATAHWHLLDRGAVDYPTQTDSNSIRVDPHPFGVIINRRHYGNRFPYYVYYSIP